MGVPFLENKGEGPPPHIKKSGLCGGGPPSFFICVFLYCNHYQDYCQRNFSSDFFIDLCKDPLLKPPFSVCFLRLESDL